MESTDKKIYFGKALYYQETTKVQSEDGSEEYTLADDNDEIIPLGSPIHDYQHFMCIEDMQTGHRDGVFYTLDTVSASCFFGLFTVEIKQAHLLKVKFDALYDAMHIAVNDTEYDLDILCQAYREVVAKGNNELKQIRLEQITFLLFPTDDHDGGLYADYKNEYRNVASGLQQLIGQRVRFYLKDKNGIEYDLLSVVKKTASTEDQYFVYKENLSPFDIPFFKAYVKHNEEIAKAIPEDKGNIETVRQTLKERLKDHE